MKAGIFCFSLCFIHIPSNSTWHINRHYINIHWINYLLFIFSKPLYMNSENLNIDGRAIKLYQKI